MKIPKELCESISSGNCVLFIGAGASREARAPSSQEIARKLSEQYLEGEYSEESLSKVAGYIEAKSGLGRNKVIDYLNTRLLRLKLSKPHLLLPKFDWAAIYTTNYDRLIEKAYEKNGQECKPVIWSSDLVTTDKSTSNYDCVLVYKPHGCISQPSSIVITEDDYHNTAADKRRGIYKQLELHRYTHTFLFVGYSFSDFDLSRIWFDVSKELGRLSKWAYALWPSCSEVQRSMWENKYVRLIDAEFKEFMKELHSISSGEREEEKFSISDDPEVEKFVKSFLLMLEAKDRDQKKHSIRVQKLALMISEEMGLSTEKHKLLKVAALLHDIGYIAVPDYVTKKPAALTISEFSFIKRHSNLGGEIVASIPCLEDASRIIKHHHEQFDGSGYPDRLAGKSIPLLSRIIAVADALHALLANRPYREAYNLKESISEIKRISGTLFDPAVVRALEKLYDSNKLRKLD